MGLQLKTETQTLEQVVLLRIRYEERLHADKDIMF